MKKYMEVNSEKERIIAMLDGAIVETGYEVFRFKNTFERGTKKGISFTPMETVSTSCLYEDMISIYKEIPWEEEIGEGRLCWGWDEEDTKVIFYCTTYYNKAIFKYVNADKNSRYKFATPLTNEEIEALKR